MPDWTDDLEVEEERARRKDVRRAVLGGIAGVAMLVAPIILANALVPEDGDDVKAEDESTNETTLAALRRQAETRQAEEAARAEAATALRTTTTPPPPPPTEPPTTVPETTTTTEAPAPVDPPPSSGGGLGDPYDYASWDALAECESGGNWATNTGNGYYGGIQFSLSSWEGVGGTGYPHEASRETQITMGQRLWEGSGWGAWPACSSKLGFR